MEEHTERASNSGVDPASVEFYKKLAASVRPDDPEWMESFRENATYPLHVAVMFQEDLCTIQRLYEEYPFQLYWDTILQACKYGSKPGVIPLLLENHNDWIPDSTLLELCACNDGHYIPGEISQLASRIPKAVSVRERGRGRDYPIAAAMSNEQMEEEDIQTLIDLWPECLVTPMNFFGGAAYATPLQMCLKAGYSTNLLKHMMEKLPPVIGDFTIYNEPLSAEDLQWIDHIFQICRGKIHFGLGFDPVSWKGTDFHHFLGMCFFQNHCFKEMELKLPSAIASSPEDTDMIVTSCKKLEESYYLESSHPRIEKLTLEFSHPAYCRLLDFLPKWKDLTELELSLEDLLEPSVTALCNLLEEGKLKLLFIDTRFYPLDERERQDLSQEALQPLFHVIATNQKLATLKLTELNESSDLVVYRHLQAVYPQIERTRPPDDEKTMCCNLLLNALRQNNTLTGATGFFPEEWGGCCSELSDEQEKIGYFLKLNQCGRKHAQDASSTLGDFVSLLVSVEQQLALHNEEKRFGLRRGPKDHFNALYGLLQEGISKWS